LSRTDAEPVKLLGFALDTTKGGLRSSCAGVVRKSMGIGGGVAVAVEDREER
jgi:hypothetical protein